MADEPATLTPPEDAYDPKSRSTYMIVSKVAYLLGVARHIFENDNEPPKLDVYKQLEMDKNARIVRNLCILRTAIERNFKAIMERMRFEYKSLMTIDEVPQDVLMRLAEDGISIVKSKSSLVEYVVQINKILTDRINNCRSLFPIWANWLYIRDIFLMPDGLSENGTKAAAAVYYEKKA